MAKVCGHSLKSNWPHKDRATSRCGMRGSLAGVDRGDGGVAHSEEAQAVRDVVEADQPQVFEAVEPAVLGGLAGAGGLPRGQTLRFQ